MKIRKQAFYSLDIIPFPAYPEFLVHLLDEIGIS